MQKIIQEIYRGNIDELELAKPPVEKNNNKECELYEKLYQTLTQEQKNLFNEFLELFSLNQGNYAEHKYIRGFKIGLLLGLECANFKL